MRENIGQFLSFVGALLVAYSIFSKNKKNMIALLLGTTGICTLVNIFLKGYSRAVANLLLSVRNFLEIKGKLTATYTAIICVLLVSFGTYLNSNGFIGYFPVVASTLFVIFSYTIKSVQYMRLLVALSQFLWSFYDFTIKSYPAFVMDWVIIILSVTKFIQVALKDKKESELKEMI